MSNTALIFQAILISVLLTIGISWISIRIALRLNLVDKPNSAPHKRHLRPTPLAGGIALMATLLLVEAFFGILDHPDITATFLAGAVIFVFGIVDDSKNLTPKAKLAGQVLAAIILIAQGVHIKLFESPDFFIQVDGELKVYLDWLITILWIVGITNAFNFVDSMDGLSVGLAGMAAAFFILVTLDAQQPALSIHSAVLIGACVGLYYFNTTPAKLFLGDAGAQTLGLVLAVLGIAYQPIGANQSSSWLVPIMLLGVPIFDAALVIISRFRRRRPIYTAAQDHTYHRLLHLGLDSFHAVLMMQGAALILGCLAFIILPLEPLKANIIFVSILLAGILGLAYLDQPRHWRKLLGKEEIQSSETDPATNFSPNNN